jgi:hypothetical protein
LAGGATFARRGRTEHQTPEKAMNKSEARAMLRHVATYMPNQAAVNAYAAAIMSGREDSKDHICNILEAAGVLSEELAAWKQLCGDRDHECDQKCRARYVLDFFAGSVNQPTTAQVLIDEEVYNKLDVYQYLFLDNDPDVSRMLCELMQAVFAVREDLIAWGRDDLNGWEKVEANR